MKTLSITIAILIIGAFMVGVIITKQTAEGKSPAEIKMAEKREGDAVATFAGGCFWCVESDFEKVEGVREVVSGYTGGRKPNPTYEEVCSGRTGHTEVVRVVFDPTKIGYEELLRLFWEGHDPTQGMRQGNDVGTQYRSAIYTYGDEQRRQAETSVEAYQKALAEDLRREGKI